MCIGEDHRIYICRKPEEGWRPDLVERREKCQVKFMIRESICCNGIRTLCKVDCNIYDILEDDIWPVIARHFPRNNYLFQDDNAPVHRAAVTRCSQWTKMYELTIPIPRFEHY